MSVALITHPACLTHDTGMWHPESPDRLRAVLRALETEEFHPLLRELAPQATFEQLHRVHPKAHIDHILSVHPEGAKDLSGPQDSREALPWLPGYADGRWVVWDAMRGGTLAVPLALLLQRAEGVHARFGAADHSRHLPRPQRLGQGRRMRRTARGIR